MEIINHSPTECFYEIKPRVVTTKKSVVKKLLFIQKKNTTLPKKPYDKLSEWTSKILKSEKFSEYKKNPPMQDGITFDEGILEQNIKSKILFNKEKLLRQKFAKEHESRGGTKKKGLKEIAEGPKRERVKVPNVMFFEDYIDEQKEVIQDMITRAVDKVKADLGLDRIMFNKFSMFRTDRNSGKILDYLMLFFDNKLIAQGFCEEMQGKMFNKCILAPEILPQRNN